MGFFKRFFTIILIAHSYLLLCSLLIMVNVDLEGLYQTQIFCVHLSFGTIKSKHAVLRMKYQFGIVSNRPL